MRLLFRSLFGTTGSGGFRTADNFVGTAALFGASAGFAFASFAATIGICRSDSHCGCHGAGENQGRHGSRLKNFFHGKFNFRVYSQ